VALLLGLLLKLYALGRGTINSDEAVVGLMAREILHGHFFAFYWAEQPFTWYWNDGRYAIFLAPALALVVVSLVREVGIWAIGSPRFAPAIMAGLVLIGALGLTLVAARAQPPYKRQLALPAVERTSWLSWHTNPNNLPTALADSLLRWHVRYAFSSYWLGYDVGFLSDGHVTVSPAGPELIRYSPYYRAIAASPTPAWIFVSPALAEEAATEAGTTALDPSCLAPDQQCLLVPERAMGAIAVLGRRPVRRCRPALRRSAPR
jgi:hypothetical protein